MLDSLAFVNDNGPQRKVDPPQVAGGMRVTTASPVGSCA
jgi:hypothetical protein